MFFISQLFVDHNSGLQTPSPSVGDDGRFLHLAGKWSKVHEKEIGREEAKRFQPRFVSFGTFSGEKNHRIWA